MLIRTLATLCLVVLVGCEQSPPSSTAAPSAGDVETSLQAAETYIDAMDLDKAEVILERLIEVAPEHARAREAYGRLLLFRVAEARAAGRVAEVHRLQASSHDQYRRALEFAPDDPLLHHAAGEVAQAAGRADAALTHYLRAVELAPDEPRHRIFAVQLLLNARRFDEALTHLDVAVEQWPDEPMVHGSLAALALQQQAYDEARQHIIAARDLDPRDAALRVLEARIHRSAGDPRRAIELLVALPPDQRAIPAIAIELGDGYAALDEHLKAAQAYEIAYRPSLNDRTTAAMIAGRIGLAVHRGGKDDLARRWLGDAIELDPTVDEVRSLRAALEPGDG